MTLRDNTLSIFAERQCSTEALNTLKEYYKGVINSQRRYDSIVSLETLLAILQRRDVLNDETRDEVLEQIARTINCIERSSLQNMPNSPSQSAVLLPVLGEPPKTDLEYVHRKIANQMGSMWREFARGLDIGENYIDQLDIVHTKDPIKIVNEILLYHREACKGHEWSTKLIKALRKARRSDLVEHLETHILRAM